jgi:hypothetical protein
MRPAVAVIGGGEKFMAAAESGEQDVARRAIQEFVGEWVLEEDEGLGRGEPVDGSAGRGAEGWVAVIEWAASAVVAGATWDGLKLAARRAKETVDRIRASEPARPLISRGMALLLAVQYVVETDDEQGGLEVEAIEEPSMLGGRPAIELSYVGVEPWLVSLVNRDRTWRYVVAVNPDGTIAALLPLEMSEGERLYWRPLGP